MKSVIWKILIRKLTLMVLLSLPQGLDREIKIALWMAPSYANFQDNSNLAHPKNWSKRSTKPFTSNLEEQKINY